MLTEEMKKVVREQRLGFVATVCPNNTPNLSPKGTTDVWDERHLVFADIRSPETIANLRRNPAVEINVVDPISRKGFRFKGTARIIEEGELFEEILEFYSRRGTGSRIQVAVLVKVERALPVISPVYDSGKPEEEVRKHWEKHFRLK